MMNNLMCKRKSNDSLVDYLVYYCYIRTRKLELAFRAVDQGYYLLRSYAYIPFIPYSWGDGKIHLSAANIYAKVLEVLDLQPGMSFLNIGSGTGYLSTLAGLLLKQHGTNHGIELYEDCLKYAYRCLDDFKKSQALDKFGFCEPVFTQGNCLNLTPDRQYDRVYCGANCPEQYVEFMKKFVKVHGVLVMPVNDNVVRLERKSETDWCEEKVLSVRFETLVVPTPEEKTHCHLPKYTPLPLQELCRGVVRDSLQERIWGTHHDIETIYWLGSNYISDMVHNLSYNFHRALTYEPVNAVSTKKITVIHVDDDSFTAHMRENIRQLPLPHPLKLYVNYNRCLIYQSISNNQESMKIVLVEIRAAFYP